ncbi:MAG: 23S rRNA (uracil(1939)-C(5))-methyltransferase RlmD [Lachnospiraceae bacterium]|nr:23S rRNA (uracil(1939)-C(5))-methyltransferase RlmD [Lachnospiraceae bacterium]
MEYKKNDIVTVSIDDIGNDGEGIGKIDGYALFVKDAVIGDIVEARITKVKKNYGYARVEKVITPSSFRVEPRCAFHRQCGGCQIQAMSYEKQLTFKQDKIRNNLIRIGGFEKEFIDKVMEPIVGMEDPWHYRNKAQYPVGYDKNGKLVTGFYAGRTHDIIPNTDCALGVHENKLILETVLSYMNENHVTAYRENTGEGLVRHILIRTGFSSGEIMVCLVINGKKLPAEKELIRKLTEIDFDSEEDIENVEDFDNEEAFEKADLQRPARRIVSVCVSINTERTNVIMGKEIRILWGRGYIEDSIRIMKMADEGERNNLFEPTNEKVTFHISPLSFYQVNSVQTEKLYSIALDYAGLTGKETVWDLYCGIGTISLFLAKAAGYVYGVEVIPQAIEDARENARINGIENVEFYVGEAEEVLPDKYEKEGIHADIIVVDPPRKGCDARCLETMLAMKPERIVYVSCDSATLARDLRVLVDGGYEVRRVKGVDQFGHGVHVETVCQLVRKDADESILGIAGSMVKRKVNYREEEIADCGCIYG